LRIGFFEAGGDYGTPVGMLTELPWRRLMTITLKPEQEQVLIEAINSGLADTTEQALDQALEALRERLPQQTASVDESVAAAARRLATFGQRHGLSLGGLTIKELLHESRP
jgi:hypothetical protein